MFNRRVYAVSNAHLDTQWNWTIQDTIRDCVKNTMDVNFENIEGTKHYVMNFEGAFRYKLMKEYYPEKYEQLKKYIADGRWNVAGSFWDSCDVNVPSSEALMRQAILGNNYFEEEFGKRSYDIFLPDCFGFRYSIPSIASHMGIIGFSTQKLTWGVGTPIINDDGSVTKPMPGYDFNRMDLGKWEGPDGKRIYVSLDEGGYGFQFKSEDGPVKERADLSAKIDKNEKNTGYPWYSRYFGVGDYGGGCTLDCAKLVDEAVDAKGGLYDVVSSSTIGIFEDVIKAGDEKLPVYKGNLLIPHGYGALTSHTISKRWNRKNELLADAAERASIVAELETGKPYPKERIRNAWKTFLWHQFHDDITGTSICNAYTFSYNDYVIALNTFAGELSASVDAIASILDTDVSGTPVIVYNPTGTVRKDTVSASVEIYSKFVRVYDENGKEVPSQISKDGKSVIFTARTPAVSFGVYDIRPSDSAYNGTLCVSDNTLENTRYKVTVDVNGDVSSVYDKLYSKEMLSSPICMQISESNSISWPSWELGFEDTLKEPRFVRDDVKVSVGENGGAFVSLIITRKYERSEFTQTVSLAEGSDLVRFDNKINWYSTNALLKANFPLTVKNPLADFDLGLGVDRLGNTDSYPYFQHCVHQWADLTDEDGTYGVTVMNDCKYGMDKPDDSTLRLTLIHTPSADYQYQSMQSWQDMGRNEFAFAIAGHSGKREGMAALAEGFNSPLLPFGTDKHKGTKRSICAIEKNNDNVLIRAFKKEYRGERVILRLQETLGEDGKVSVKLGYPTTNAVNTNGYEEYISDETVKDNTLSVDIGYYAPKTFALELCGVKSENFGFTPVALDYDIKTTTSNCDKSSGDVEITIPEELFVEETSANGVPYKLGKKDGKNALVCKGQTIKLPEKAKEAYLLMASESGDKTVLINGQKIKVQDQRENVGTWDIIAIGNVCNIKRADIAHVFTHTHDKDGDRLYLPAYLFAYKVKATDTITLPNDADILVYAITASEKEHNTCAVTPLYDEAQIDTSKLHRLKFYGMNGELLIDKDYIEGSRIMVTIDSLPGDCVFDHFEGGNVIINRDISAMILMGNEDVVLKTFIKKIGENVVVGKPYKASHEMCDEERGCYAINNKLDDKWCGDADESGAAWLEVDLGEVTSINKWYVVHCGVYESTSWNSRDFELRYKVNENDEWSIADTVVENRSNTTLREFAPVDARYVCLYLTKPCGRRGKTARIYNFAVFRTEK